MFLFILSQRNSCFIYLFCFLFFSCPLSDLDVGIFLFTNIPIVCNLRLVVTKVGQIGQKKKMLLSGLYLEKYIMICNRLLHKNFT